MVSTLVSVIVVAGSVAMAGLLIVGTGMAARRTSHDARRVTTVAALIIGGWLAVAFLLARAGAFASEPDTNVPTITLGLSLPIIIGITAWYRSDRLRELAASAPLPWLIGVQLYRVLGAVFLVAMVDNALPQEFALPAGVGDIVVGVTAPAVAYALYKGVLSAKSIAIGWNILGIADLVVAVGTGFLTSPSVFQMLSLDAPNFAITRFPLVLIPTFLVPISIILHFLALKHPDLQVARGRQPTPVTGLVRR